MGVIGELLFSLGEIDPIVALAGAPLVCGPEYAFDTRRLGILGPVGAGRGARPAPPTGV